MMTQWAKVARRVQEKKKAKAKEKMVANKAEKDSEYGAKMAIMADLGGPTKLSGKVTRRFPLSHNPPTPTSLAPRGQGRCKLAGRDRIRDSRSELAGRSWICSPWKPTGIHVVHVQREVQRRVEDASRASSLPRGVDR